MRSALLVLVVGAIGCARPSPLCAYDCGTLLAHPTMTPANLASRADVVVQGRTEGAAPRRQGFEETLR